MGFRITPLHRWFQNYSCASLSSESYLYHWIQNYGTSPLGSGSNSSKPLDSGYSSTPQGSELQLCTDGFRTTALHHWVSIAPHYWIQNYSSSSLCSKLQLCATGFIITTAPMAPYRVENSAIPPKKNRIALRPPVVWSIDLAGYPVDCIHVRNPPQSSVLCHRLCIWWAS